MSWARRAGTLGEPVVIFEGGSPNGTMDSEAPVADAVQHTLSEPSNSRVCTVQSIQGDIGLSTCLGSMQSALAVPVNQDAEHRFI